MGLIDTLARVDPDSPQNQAQTLQNEETQRKLDKDKKMEGVLSRMADRIDSYNGATQDQEGPGLTQLGGPQDPNATPGNTYRAPDASGGLQPVGPQDAQHRVGFGMYQNPALFANPKFLNETAQDFMRAGVPEGVKWLEAGYHAHKEGMVTALQRAVGGDLQGAEKAFNSTGDEKITPGSLKWKDDQKTTLSGKHEDGSDFEMQPRELLKSLMSPKDYFDQSSKEREAAAKESQANSEEELRSAQADYYRGAKSALANAQANKAANGGKLSDKDLNTIVGRGGIALRKQIESEQSKEDAKFNVSGMTSLLPQMQKDLGQSIRNGDDPEVALDTVYNQYKDRVSTLNDGVMGAVRDANKGNYFQSSKDKSLADGLQNFMADKGVTPEEIKKYLPATKVGASDQERIRSALGQIKTQGAVNAAPREVQDRFSGDKSMASYKLGAQTSRGFEVKDNKGKTVGYYK